MKSKSFFKMILFAFVSCLFSFDSVKGAERDFTVELVGLSNPVGHTHSCYNATCPARMDTGYANVWDHRTNAGHNCQYCGTEVTVQDYGRPRVTIFRRIVKAAVRVSTAWIPPAARVARVAWNPPAVRGWVPPVAAVSTVRQTTVVTESSVVPVAVPVAVPVTAPVVQYTLPTAIGGCSGAGCASQPTGWYLGKNLRR